MKKIKIENTSNEVQKLYLYESVEALFDSQYSGIMPDDDEYCYVITLAQDEAIEAEWLGCEIEQLEDESFQTLSYLRLVKTYTPSISSGAIVSIYAGWSFAEKFPFKTLKQGDLLFTRFDEKQQSIDVSNILQDYLEEEVKVPEPKLLN